MYQILSDISVSVLYIVNIKKKIYINVPSDLPWLLLSIQVQFEQFFLLFDLLDSKEIVFVYPTLVKFRVLFKNKLLINNICTKYIKFNNQFYCFKLTFKMYNRIDLIDITIHSTFCDHLASNFFCFRWWNFQ